MNNLKGFSFVNLLSITDNRFTHLDKNILGFIEISEEIIEIKISIRIVLIILLFGRVSDLVNLGVNI